MSTKDEKPTSNGIRNLFILLAVVCFIVYLSPTETDSDNSVPNNSYGDQYDRGLDETPPPPKVQREFLVNYWTDIPLDPVEWKKVILGHRADAKGTFSEFLAGDSSDYCQYKWGDTEKIFTKKFGDPDPKLGRPPYYWVRGRGILRIEVRS